jgi:hypothetical protein
VVGGQVIDRSKLGDLDRVGQGGQGIVYAAPNVKTKFATSMVYKEYKSAALPGVDFTVLAAMPALVEDSMPYATAQRLIGVAAWPCALVHNGGTPRAGAQYDPTAPILFPQEALTGAETIIRRSPATAA